MELGLGYCYEVLLTSGETIRFRLLGNTEGDDRIIVETPPGSGKREDLLQLLRGGFQGYRRVECP